MAFPTTREPYTATPMRWHGGEERLGLDNWLNALSSEPSRNFVFNRSAPLILDGAASRAKSLREERAVYLESSKSSKLGLLNPQPLGLKYFKPLTLVAHLVDSKTLVGVEAHSPSPRLDPIQNLLGAKPA